tara:strand:- start:159 stop:401 length:243 start_codon:yes stop_codon:yes gene_type:complete
MATLSLSSLSLSTVKDVNSAFESKSTCLLERNEWIYFIDMETMNEVKAFYMASSKTDGSLSLMRVFNAIAKFSLTNNIKF